MMICAMEWLGVCTCWGVHLTYFMSLLCLLWWVVRSMGVEPGLEEEEDGVEEELEGGGD